MQSLLKTFSCLLVWPVQLRSLRSSSFLHCDQYKVRLSPAVAGNKHRRDDFHQEISCQSTQLILNH